MKKLFVLAMLLATPAYAEIVNLQWEAPTTGVAVAYHIYASTTSGTDYYGVNAVKAPASGCTIVLPDDGKTYYLIIKAFNGTVEGPPGNCDAAQVCNNGVEIVVPTKFIPPPGAANKWKRAP